MDEIWVIVPFSRPGNLARVRENFDRQHFAGKRLVVVENGAAVGCCAAAGFTPDLLLSSDAMAAVARNVALDAVREASSGAYVVNMDDDDWYGPHYLTEHAELAERRQIVGKSTHFVHFEGRCIALFRPWGAHQRSGWGNAGTLGGFVDEFPHYPALRVGEENALFKIWTSHYMSGRVLLSSIFHTAYCRRPDTSSHTYAEGDRQFFRNMGHHAACFPEGAWDVVGGERGVSGAPLGVFRYENWPWREGA